MKELIIEQGNEKLNVKIGDGATICWYSDRTPVTIIEIGKNYVKVQEDTATRIDNNGMSDTQEYKYEKDINGVVHTFKKTRKGLFTDNGRSDNYSKKLLFGFRKKYYDYTF